jgi:hypothetical protein
VSLSRDYFTPQNSPKAQPVRAQGQAAQESFQGAWRHSRDTREQGQEALELHKRGTSQQDCGIKYKGTHTSHNRDVTATPTLTVQTEYAYIYITR